MKKKTRGRSGGSRSTKYSCSYCEYSSRTYNCFEVHVRSHTGEKPFICTTCNKSFSGYWNLLRHEQLHTGFTKFYPCQVCQKSCTNRSDLKKHQRVHAGGRRKPYSHKRELSGKPFLDSSYTRLHLPLRILGREEMSATESFPTPAPSSPILIKEEVSDNDETLSVSEFHTDLITSTDTDLNEYKRIHHLSNNMKKNASIGATGGGGSSSAKYSCSYCEYSSLTYNCFEVHVRSHTGEKPFICTTCNKSFSGYWNLLRHEKLHTGFTKLYPCQVCQKSCTNSSDLKKHQRVHADGKRRRYSYRLELYGKPTVDSSYTKPHSPHGRIHKREEITSRESSPTSALSSLDVIKEEVSDNDDDESLPLPASEFYTDLITNNASDLDEEERIDHVPAYTDNHKDEVREDEEELYIDDKPFVCEFCPMLFISSAALVEHKRIHTGNSCKKLYSCERCKKSFVTRTQLTSHLRRTRTHNGEASGCVICNKSFSNRFNLARHKKRHHDGIKLKPYSCEECKKSFAERSYLVIHRRIHTGEKPYACEVCDKSFVTISSLNRHRKIHTVEKPCPCDGETNDKSLPSSSSTAMGDKLDSTRTTVPTSTNTNHQPIQNESNLCEICAKSFKRPSNLRIHQKNIHSAKRSAASCQFCTKIFANSSEFESHKRIHVGRNTYSCEHCRKLFQSYRHVLSHTRTHTGEKPYLCDLCGRSFIGTSQLNKHTRLHNSKTVKVRTKGNKPFKKLT